MLRKRDQSLSGHIYKEKICGNHAMVVEEILEINPLQNEGQLCYKCRKLNKIEAMRDLRDEQ